MGEVAPGWKLREVGYVNSCRSVVVVIAALLSLVAAAPLSAKPGWLTNFKEAQEQAKSGKKLVLLDFTGSDWCGWCIKLEREVFSKPEFKQYAEKNLVLMEIDFPKGKQLSSTERAQNEQLAMQYGIEGFPTIILVDGDGKKVGQLSYESALPENTREMKASPEAFIASVEKLRKS